MSLVILQTQECESISNIIEMKITAITKRCYKKGVKAAFSDLSMLMAVRFRIDAVQHITSAATHASQSVLPSSHTAWFH